MSMLNIRIPDELHKRLKIAKPILDKDIRDIVIDAVSEYLDNHGHNK